MIRVEGNRILKENGEELRFFGVNCAGLEWDSKDSHIEESVHAALTEWGVNLIRLPISQDRWFGFGYEQRKKQNFLAYRQLVDRVIADAKQHNAHVLFELHWSDMGTWGNAIGQHSMPDLNSVVFWRDAAFRYRNAENVLFGLYNEPRYVSWEVWKNGGIVTETDSKTGEEKKYETPGMTGLIRAIRETGARNCIVAGGLDWAYTFEGMQEAVGDLCDEPEGNGIVFDSHIYPWKRLEWDQDVTIISGLHPVLIGEYGHYGNDATPREGKQCLPSEEWLPRLLEWVEKNGYSCCAWDFHPYAGPCLIRDFSYAPTDYFGVYVKQYIQARRNDAPMGRE